MKPRSSTNPLVVIGENSFIRLSEDEGATIAARASHWRVYWSPAGVGHALFIDPGRSRPIELYADSVELARYLQTAVECYLYKPFGDVSLSIVSSSFERDGAPPSTYREIVRFRGGEILLEWLDFLRPFNFATEPGDDGRPIGLQTTFIPARQAGWSGTTAAGSGSPWQLLRDGQPCTSACLAWAETWRLPAEP